MDPRKQTILSKKLARVLRHQANAMGFNISSDGFINVSELLNHHEFSSFTLDNIKYICATCPKQRYELKAEDLKWLIRARQGHSMRNVRDEGLLEKIRNPDDIPLCIHGTYKDSVSSISSNGLNKMSRNHIHMATSLPNLDGVISGMRASCDILIIVNVKKAMEDGIEFYRSGNGVILSPGLGTTGAIPPQYLTFTRRDNYTINLNHACESDTKDVKANGASSPQTFSSSRVHRSGDASNRVQHLNTTHSKCRAGATPYRASSTSTEDFPSLPSKSSNNQDLALKFVDEEEPVVDIASSSVCSTEEAKIRGGGGEVAQIVSHKRRHSQRNVPDYYCVIDFEATCENNIQIDNQEIIEFPAVFVNTKTHTIDFEFHSYIRPIHNPVLTPFCTSLTGIEQHTVDQAPEFQEVLKKFEEFMSDHDFCLSGEGTQGQRTFAFVTHGDWDLKTMLATQCGLSNLEIPSAMKHWINIKTIVKSVYPMRRLGMENVLKELKIPLVGRHHSGIDDSRNIASIVLHMMSVHAM